MRHTTLLKQIEVLCKFAHTTGLSAGETIAMLQTQRNNDMMKKSVANATELKEGPTVGKTHT